MDPSRPAAPLRLGCPEVLSAGGYACSPVGERFACTFEHLELRPCGWARHAP